MVGARTNDWNAPRQVHITEKDRAELRNLALELFGTHGPDAVGKRNVIAVGACKSIPLYRYGRTRHKPVRNDRVMQLGDKFAKSASPAGISPTSPHALIAATPAHKRGGIGKHKDQECIPPPTVGG